ncbi:hypothetical protein VMCG_07429 [Cytospora schulzeri]|uniref:tRNA(Phe) (4-demethylwyosine(37)-C(7)) aminocarboxypropyltransferase n=1 Tax=Cytospora schulzeri TaxID=448051 RepID=A0A423W342_9PEZI|nr:hypothetical protein VMCG_07429 [Valsa malicola]
MPRSRPKPPNSVSFAVTEWFNHYSSELSALGATVETLVAEAPKRWVIYEPVILLPSGSFTSPNWMETLAALSQDCRDHLWSNILREIGRGTREETAYLAVSDGIPLTVTTHSDTKDEEGQKEENILRSPTGLRILLGDFGPPETKGKTVSDEDFVQALWASTTQNSIRQTWAPRWTMFSRGNVKEKARLLAFHDPPKSPQREAEPEMPHRVRTRQVLAKTWAVDLYAGIGYFVFCYAKLGMRVLCWEINPWSVEGLRRGARANGWSVKVIKDEDLVRPTADLVSGDDTIVIFLENNQEATRRVRELRAHGLDIQVSHVNCGLLPRSDYSWEAAREILGEDGDGWLHLHENVGAADIEPRKGEIQKLFDALDESGGDGRVAKVEHVELVKTFAPELFKALLLILHLLVLSEVLDVFRVCQVLELGVLVMVEFPMVDLILVLVITMVSRPRANVRQRATLNHKDLKLVLGDDAVPVIVGQFEHLADDLLFPPFRDVLVGVVEQAVRPQDLLGLPLPVGIEVVQGEEGACVELGSVMLS